MKLPFLPSARSLPPTCPTHQSLNSAHSTSHQFPKLASPDSSLHCCGPNPQHPNFGNRQHGIYREGGYELWEQTSQSWNPFFASSVFVCILGNVTYLACLILCKKEIFTLTCKSQLNIKYLEPKLVVQGWSSLNVFFLPWSRPTLDYCVHGNKTVPPNNKPNQMAHLRKDTHWFPIASGWNLNIFT